MLRLAYFPAQLYNMKKAPFLGLLVLLSVLCGYLFSKASLVGKAGMTFIYKEYAFLKTWWQGALFVVAVWLLLFLLQGRAQRYARSATARRIHIGCMIAALVGLYLTYQDFRHTLSHRLLGERFHLGGYLFWIGWMLIAVYWLADRNKKADPAANLEEIHTSY